LPLLVLLVRRQRYVRLLGELTLEQPHLRSPGAQLLDERGTERDGPGARLSGAHDRNILPAVRPLAGNRVVHASQGSALGALGGRVGAAGAWKWMRKASQPPPRASTVP